MAASVVDVQGMRYEFSSNIVEIIELQRRTHTSIEGEGRIVATGASNTVGKSYITSTSTDHTDVFFRRGDGTEGRWTSSRLPPVRVGQHLRFVEVSGEFCQAYLGMRDNNERFRLVKRLLVGVQVEETREFVKLDGFDSKGELSFTPLEDNYMSGGSLLFIGIVATLFFGLGLLILFYLAIRTLTLSLGSTFFGMPERLAHERRNERRMVLERRLREFVLV